MICLLANCCFLSETSRMLEIYRALHDREAAVRIVTQGGSHERVLRDAGVPYDVVGPRMDEGRCAAFRRSIPGIGSPDQSMWSDEELRTYVAAEVAYFRGHEVRLAVTGWTLTALLSTRLAGIPLVTEHAGAMVPPVYERGLLPAPSDRVGLPLERWLPAPVKRRLFNAAMPRLTLYTGGFNRVATELGVEGVPSFPALLLGDLTLVTDVPEVMGIARDEVDSWVPKDPSRYRNGIRLRYTGPMYARLAVPMAERVERFLSGPHPIVYVAITSSPPQLVREVVHSLRGLDVRILVAATLHDLAGLEDERVLVGGVLPSHLILPRVDVAVIAGGQGSVQSALAAGVPLVGLPLQPEQDTNVALVVRQGAARLVPQGAAGTPALARAVRKILADDRYRDNARRLQAIYARVDGTGAAADAILELAQAERRPKDDVPTATARSSAPPVRPLVPTSRPFDDPRS